MLLFIPDLLNVLPPESRAKMAALDARRHAAFAALAAAKARHNAAPGEAAKAALDAATAAYDAFDYLPACVRWLDRSGAYGRNPPIALRHVKATAPAGARNPTEAVEAIRRDLDGLEAAWRAAEHAPAKRADLMAGLKAAVDAIAEDGAPVIRERMRGGADPAQLHDVLALGLRTGGRGADAIGRLTGNPSAFFVWLLRDEIVERVGALVSRVPEEGALSDEERDARFEEIAKRRLALERQEEAVIAAAEVAGISIARRPNADPRAIMEIESA